MVLTDEVEFRKKRGYFITNILLEPRIVVYGNEKYTKLTIYERKIIRCGNSSAVIVSGSS